jgi:hypothetical protein
MALLVVTWGIGMSGVARLNVFVRPILLFSSSDQALKALEIFIRTCLQAHQHISRSVAFL